jgi:hypothetical protein
MNERMIRTEKHVTIVEAHPYHRYIATSPMSDRADTRSSSGRATRSARGAARTGGRQRGERVDLLTWPHRVGRLRLIATLHDPSVIRKIPGAPGDGSLKVEPRARPTRGRDRRVLIWIGSVIPRAR